MDWLEVLQKPYVYGLVTVTVLGFSLGSCMETHVARSEECAVLRQSEAGMIGLHTFLSENLNLLNTLKIRLLLAGLPVSELSDGEDRLLKRQAELTTQIGTWDEMSLSNCDR